MATVLHHAVGMAAIATRSSVLKGDQIFKRKGASNKKEDRRTLA